MNEQMALGRRWGARRQERASVGARCEAGLDGEEAGAGGDDARIRIEQEQVGAGCKHGFGDPMDGGQRGRNCRRRKGDAVGLRRAGAGRGASRCRDPDNDTTCGSSGDIQDPVLGRSPLGIRLLSQNYC